MIFLYYIGFGFCDHLVQSLTRNVVSYPYLTSKQRSRMINQLNHRSAIDIPDFSDPIIRASLDYTLFRSMADRALGSFAKFSFFEDMTSKYKARMTYLLQKKYPIDIHVSMAQPEFFKNLFPMIQCPLDLLSVLGTFHQISYNVEDISLEHSRDDLSSVLFLSLLQLSVLDRSNQGNAVDHILLRLEKYKKTLIHKISNGFSIEHHKFVSFLFQDTSLDRSFINAWIYAIVANKTRQWFLETFTVPSLAAHHEDLREVIAVFTDIDIQPSLMNRFDTGNFLSFLNRVFSMYGSALIEDLKFMLLQMSEIYKIRWNINLNIDTQQHLVSTESVTIHRHVPLSFIGIFFKSRDLSRFVKSRRQLLDLFFRKQGISPVHTATIFAFLANMTVLVYNAPTLEDIRAKRIFREFTDLVFKLNVQEIFAWMELSLSNRARFFPLNESDLLNIKSQLSK
jgi:hypothetical protein